jgi:Arc/MetJ-type ribon-helix-helix transcriptional regulator
MAALYYIAGMKTITIRLPEPIAADIAAESAERGISKSDVVRERLESARKPRRNAALESIADLIGSVDGLPRDLSARQKAYLRKTGYGRNRAG